MKGQGLNWAIGQRLRSVRRVRNLTQGDLAAYLGVTFQQIQKYENGTNRLSVAVMLRLCDFMEFDAAEFVSGIKAGSPQQSAKAASLTKRVRKIVDKSA